MTGDAYVSGNAIVSGHAHVSGRARIETTADHLVLVSPSGVPVTAWRDTKHGIGIATPSGTGQLSDLTQLSELWAAPTLALIEAWAETHNWNRP